MKIRRSNAWMFAAIVGPMLVACAKEPPGGAAVSASTAAAAASAAPHAAARSSGSAATAGTASATAAASATPRDDVAVPAGTFDMGSEEKYVGQTPIHKVTLSAFALDRNEVTAARYAECVAAGKCVAQNTVDDPSYSSSDQAFLKQFCNLGRSGFEQHPMNCVDHTQAAAFCGWAGKRLPTEAEWEYAARGSDGRTYPWGNDAPSVKRVNACDSTCKEKLSTHKTWRALLKEPDAFEATAPVGSLLEGKSSTGANDLSGNVWEWVADWHGPAYYAQSPEKDPQGPASGKNRAVRGGSWNDFDAKFLTAMVRFGFAPTSRFANVGFRCVKPGG